LVFTSPGIPMIFQGQEFLEDGWFDDSQPLDWGKLERFSGIFHLYEALFKLRRNWGNNTAGLRGHGINVYHVDLERQVLAYTRWQDGGPGDSVVVVLNFTAETLSDYWIGLPAGGMWKVRFNSDWNGFDPEFANTFTADVEAIEEEQNGLPARGLLNAIGPYTALILSQDTNHEP
jgi:1,4-alpha-glucan branching enzyme